VNGHVADGLALDDPIIIESETVSANTSGDETEAQESQLSLSDEQKIQKEIESVTFYIENDYNDLAEKALAALASEFGDRPEFGELRKRIGAEFEEVKPTEANGEELSANALGINEIRSEFGIEGADESENNDYETHYHTAVAYQEMGLMEQAIHEFQEAISRTQPDDGTRNFFHCANLLGHCFLQIGMANNAITWTSRALETPDISVEEYHGIWYQLALAHEANGDEEDAAKYFEKIYAENVDFRDVSERVKSLVLNH
jgi:tetratricopeptide (TPR) repeat protein